jgi:hypothetical protein
LDNPDEAFLHFFPDYSLEKPQKVPLSAWLQHCQCLYSYLARLYALSLPGRFMIDFMLPFQKRIN